MTLTGADICESVLWDEGEGSATKLWFLLSHLCRYQQGRGCDMEAEEQLCFICTGLSKKYIGMCFLPRNRCLLSHVTGLGHPSNQASFTSVSVSCGQSCWLHISRPPLSTQTSQDRQTASLSRANTRHTVPAVEVWYNMKTSTILSC